MESILRALTAGDLSNKEKDAALESLMFLKDKRDISINVRACADGRKQRAGQSKENDTLPTVSLEAVLITSMIDAYEGREVAIVAVPGEFLTADQDKVINMKLRGKLAKLMVNNSPEVYRKYAVMGKGKMVLYV